MSFVIWGLVKGENFAQTKDMITMISSFTALVLSLISFTLKDKVPNVNIYTNEKMILVKGTGFVHIPLSFINAGSATVIEYCKLKFTNLEVNKEIEFKWKSLCKDEGGVWQSGKQIAPILIKEAEGISHTITFEVEEKYKKDFKNVQEGNYTLEISVKTTEKKKIHTKKEYQFKIDNRYKDKKDTDNYEIYLSESK